MDRTEVIKINWIIYAIALFAGVIFTAYALIETANPGTGFDAEQSRFDFSLNSILFYSTISVLFILLLLFVWKKIIPYHVAALTFVSSLLLNNLILSITTGWVGLAAMLLLFLGVIVAVGMIIFVFIATRRLKNNCQEVSRNKGT